MASRVIYPPIVDDYEPAFNTEECKVYFELSKYNGISDGDPLYAHVAVMKQGNGLSVIQPTDDGDNRLRRNGRMILNIIPESDKDDETKTRYSVTLKNSDIKGGWIPGSVYKVQIRLTTEFCPSTANQSEQLNANASYFSEWSTVCIIKATGKIDLLIGEPFNYDSTESLGLEVNKTSITTINQDTLAFGGRLISAQDSSEKLKSWNLKLYLKTVISQEDDEEEIKYTLLEDTGEIFSNKYQDINEFYYFFKEELQDECIYRITFDYYTINEYHGTWSEDIKIEYKKIRKPDIGIITAEDYNPSHYHDTDIHPLTSVAEEEEDGRIGIKLKDLSGEQGKKYSTNIYIRRADETTNFTKQEDIKIISLVQQTVDEIPVFYDYTIESGVYYKYAIQEVIKEQRSLMEEMVTPIMRDFEYSFLLGEGGKQLKLKFDNTMQSFKIQQSESKVETIGNKYAIVSRNAVIEYRIFPIAGLVSFQMDDNKLFCTKNDVYGDNVELHRRQIDKGNGIEGFPPYDQVQERDFRKQVMTFLHDGKPKLFKSPTEGNILVRLLDINFTPNQSLDRLIYSFSCSANEIAEATMENYSKYKFYDIGTIVEDFSKTETRIGQLSMKFRTYDPNTNSANINPTNIIQEILNKYSNIEQEVEEDSYIRTVKKIYQIRITVNDKPIKIQLPGTTDTILGNAIKINDANPIIFYNGIYDFDGRYFFGKDTIEKMYFVSDADSYVSEIDANVDFIYDLSLEPKMSREYKIEDHQRIMGQINEVYSQNDSIFDDIYSKYYFNTDEGFQKMENLVSIEIEANPGCVIGIKDRYDGSVAEEHDINTTELLNLRDITEFNDIRYLGVRNTNGDKDNINMGIKVTYWCDLIKARYI